MIETGPAAARTIAGTAAAVCGRGLFALALLPGLLAVADREALAAPPAQEQVQRWTAPVAARLLDYIRHIDRHGLNSADYAPQALEAAIAGGEAEALEATATRSFALLARDLSRGRIAPGRRVRYYIASDTVEASRIADLIDVAIRRGEVAGVLDALAPGDPQYRAMQAALSHLPAESTAERQSLRINLERQRWLPRSLAPDRIVVNVPEYTLHLFQGGKETASFRVIVGKPATPTPQFSTQVTGVILNPSWQVPRSIIAESVGKLVRTRPDTARTRGYSWTGSGATLRVVQQPGPRNSLGQMKLDMPNPLSVYIHDTPEKALFAKESRAFSHGCMRVERPFELAARLLSPAGVSRAAIDDAVASGKTRRLPLARPLPVYVIYQTAVVEPGGAIRYLADPYRLDPGVAAQIGSSGPPAPQFTLAETECSSS